VKPLHLPRIERLDLRRAPYRTFARQMAIFHEFTVAEPLMPRDRIATVDAAGETHLIVVRPPGVWPWLVDQLLDRTFSVRYALRLWAQARVREDGYRCAGCGLVGGFDPHPYLDVVTCAGCGRQVTRLRLMAAWGRPVRLFIFGV
jgi:hypothetical protein